MKGDYKDVKCIACESTNLERLNSYEQYVEYKCRDCLEQFGFDGKEYYIIHWEWEEDEEEENEME